MTTPLTTSLGVLASTVVGEVYKTPAQIAERLQADDPEAYAAAKKAMEEKKDIQSLWVEPRRPRHRISSLAWRCRLDRLAASRKCG